MVLHNRVPKATVRLQALQCSYQPLTLGEPRAKCKVNVGLLDAFAHAGSLALPHDPLQDVVGIPVTFICSE